jgi:hypothetical protein
MPDVKAAAVAIGFMIAIVTRQPAMKDLIILFLSVLVARDSLYHDLRLMQTINDSVLYQGNNQLQHMLSGLKSFYAFVSLFDEVIIQHLQTFATTLIP